MGLIRKVKWVRCSVCQTDAPAKVVRSPRGLLVTVLFCARCDTYKDEKR